MSASTTSRGSITRHSRKFATEPLVWAIEKKIADDDARPILFYTRVANCHYPKLKGLVTQVNSIYNGQRFEDLWLDK